MKKATKILISIVAGIIIIPSIILTVWYEVYKQRPVGQPPYFDLFIANTFFERDNSTPYDKVSESKKRPVIWQLNRDQFEKLDTITLTLTNISGEKCYYTSWGAPFTRIRQDLIVYKNGIADSIPFGGFGCGTGVYLAPLHDQETIARTLYHPFMFNPYSNYELDLKSDSFPKEFKSIYGDSVSIQLSQATYSTPWNEYKSQLIFSDMITISTDKIIENWYKGNFSVFPDSEPTMEEHFGLKKFGQ